MLYYSNGTDHHYHHHHHYHHRYAKRLAEASRRCDHSQERSVFRELQGVSRCNRTTRTRNICEASWKCMVWFETQSSLFIALAAGRKSNTPNEFRAGAAVTRL